MTLVRKQKNCFLIHPTERKKLTQFLKTYLPELYSKGEEVSFSKGQALFYAGHFPFGCFWLLKGNVSFLSSRNRKRRAGCLEDPLLGFFHLLLEVPFCVDCIAEKETKVLFFPKSACLKLIKEWKKIKTLKRRNM